MGLLDEADGDLVAFWKTKNAITSIVGIGDNAKLWPDAARDSEPEPFVVFTANGGKRFNHLAGRSRARITVLHVYSWGVSREQADALAKAIYDSTVDYRGSMGQTTVMWIKCEDAPLTGFDFPTDDSNEKRYWTRDVYRIAHTEN